MTSRPWQVAGEGLSAGQFDGNPVLGGTARSEESAEASENKSRFFASINVPALGMKPTEGFSATCETS